MSEHNLCPSDGKPCTLECYQGGVFRPCASYKKDKK